jgi:acyl-CoA synthetase (NDP forming)
MPDISALLSPKSVAVIGASPNAHIIRGRIMHVLGCHKFPGNIYPVSRSNDEINGLKAYRSVADIPEQVDLAILVIPAENVADALTDCGEAGVRAAMIISSGFAEESGEAGDALQDEIRAVAEKYDLAVGGPNSEGFANMLAPLCATFSATVDNPDLPLVPPHRTDGYIGVTAQSGGIGFSFYDRGRPKELPFSYVMTTGNEACLSGLDFVDYMLDDGKTEVILMFMEDIKNPERFAPIAEKALRASKPIILTKIGRSEAGQRAAASHTAAMTGAYSAYKAMFDKYGVIEGYDIEDIVDLAAGFSRYRNKLPLGKRVGIATGSGGGGGWMADSCEAAGLAVPPLDAATRAVIDEFLPPYGTSQNPVDGTAQAIRQVGYGKMAGMVAQSPEVDSVIVVTSARNAAGYEREEENLKQVAAESDKPILFCSYTLTRGTAMELLNRAGYPLYTNMRNCARTMAAMADYQAFRDRFLKTPEITTTAGGTKEKAAKLLADADAVLCEYQATPVLAAYGIAVPNSRLAATPDDAAAALDEIGGPVALKVQSPDVLHKTDAGAVALGLEDAPAIQEAFSSLTANATAYHKKTNSGSPDIHGVLVQPMAKRGQEIILGINHDDAFGPMLMVGLGGIHVEVLRDVAFSPVPLTTDGAAQVLDRLKGRKILDGVRGAPAADIDALLDLIVKLSRLAADHADTIAEIDLNPVLVHPAGEGVSVVDALIVKRDAG